MIKKITFIVICFALFACQTNKKKESENNAAATTKTEIKYAKGFSIRHFENYTLIVVRNPWDTTQTLERYVLVDRKRAVPTNLPAGNVVKVPVQRVATCSSVFAGEYKLLNAIHLIVAVSDPQYVDIPEIKNGLKNGSITNLGVTTSLDLEKLLVAKTDILIVSPFEASMHDRFKKYGVCVVKDASYMEETPLGRAEWIKFEAAFLGKSKLANKIFSGTENRYLKLSKQALTVKNRPTVFTETKFGDSWYIAGGKSYMGSFMKDAGANYIFRELKNSGSMPFSFEKVYAAAINADYWLIKYNDCVMDLTYKRLGEQYELYKNFNAFKKKNVYAVNSGTSAFYEEGPLEPDVVLADMIKIFHPELLPNYKPKYYKPIN
jgi:iron complex transport system substrate-binding protein